MHFLVYAFTKKRPSHSNLSALLGPYGDGREWDWWSRGGRWSGHLSGYDPEKDPANYNPCEYCEEGITTQKIADRFPVYLPDVGKTCIQCQGTSRVLSWPTEWKKHSGDTQRVGDILHLLTPSDDHHAPYAYIADDEGEWRSHEVHNPLWDRKSNDYSNYMIEDPCFKRDYLETIQRYLTGYVTVIDCHN